MPAQDGTWLPGEAALRRWAEERLGRVWASWGYREVEAPVWLRWERLAAVEGLIPLRACRFLDHRGEVLALRPDHTVALAGLAVAELRDEPRPLRLAYRGPVYRRRADGSFGVRWEAGVELMGAAGPVFDAEAVALAAQALRELGLDDFRVAVGHAGVLAEMLSAAGLPGEERDRFLLALQDRDYVAAEAVARRTGAAGLLSLLPGGGAPGAEGDVRPDVIVTAPAGAESGAGGFSAEAAGQGRGEAALLERLLAELGLAGHLVWEPHLVRDVDYYTGLVFEVTCRGRPRPLAGGGRYDRLLGRLGREEAAVGFAFDLEELVAALAERGLGPGRGAGGAAGGGGAALAVPVAPGAEETAWAEAVALRRAGLAAALAGVGPAC